MKRVLSLLFALTLLVSLVPTGAFADGESVCNCTTACTADGKNESCQVCKADPAQCAAQKKNEDEGKDTPESGNVPEGGNSGNEGNGNPPENPAKPQDGENGESPTSKSYGISIKNSATEEEITSDNLTSRLPGVTIQVENNVVTITATADVSLGNYTLVIGKSTIAVLDLNGKTLRSGETTVSNSGALTVKNGTIVTTGVGGNTHVIYNGGTLTIESGAVLRHEMEGFASLSNTGRVIAAGGIVQGYTVNESGGTIQAGTDPSSVTEFQGNVDNFPGSSISGGKFTGEKIAGKRDGGDPSGGTDERPVTIRGGEFYGNVSPSDVTFAIEGGTFHGLVSIGSSSSITNGTFYNEVVNEGTISGGTYYKKITENKGSRITGHLHTRSGAAEPSENDPIVTFRALDFNNLPASGDYYLEEDTDLTNATIPGNFSITLCLNGNKLTVSEAVYANIQVVNNAREGETGTLVVIYPVKVDGTQVTSENMGSLLNGKAVYTPAQPNGDIQTLTLEDGCKIPVLEVTGNIRLVSKGKTSLSRTAVSGDLILGGAGTLTVTGGLSGVTGYVDCDGYAVYAGDSSDGSDAVFAQSYGELAPELKEKAYLRFEPLALRLTALPGALDFGKAVVGYTAPAAQSFTVTNTGNGQLDSWRVTGDNEEFAVTVEKEGKPLMPGETARVTVQPKAGLTVGTHTVTLTVSVQGELVPPDIQITTQALVPPDIQIVAQTAEDGAEKATVTATFTVQNQYTLSFDSKGGSAVSAVTAAAGTPIDLTKYVTTRAGYHFDGWYLMTGTTETRAEAVILDANMTVYAKWTPETYKITYHLDGGAAEGNPDTYTVESRSVLLTRPTREGYTFTGWSGTGLTGEENMSVLIAKGSTGDREYTAHWEENIYTVRFNANGHGSAPASQQVKHGQTAASPAKPTAKNWRFGGWYTSKDCKKDEKWDFKTPVTEEMVLYAKWTANSGSAMTGDNAPIVWVAAIAGISGAALLAITIVNLAKKKRK